MKLVAVKSGGGCWKPGLFRANLESFRINHKTCAVGLSVIQGESGRGLICSPTSYLELDGSVDPMNAQLPAGETLYIKTY